MQHSYPNRFLPDNNNQLWCKLDPSRDGYLNLDRSRQVDGYAPVLNIPLIKSIKPYLSLLLMIGIDGSVTCIRDADGFSDGSITTVDLPPVKDFVIIPIEFHERIVLLTVEGVVLKGKIDTLNTIRGTLEQIAVDIDLISLVDDNSLLMIDSTGKVTWKELSCQLPSPVRLINDRLIVLENDDLVVLNVDYDKDIGTLRIFIVNIDHSLGRIIGIDRLSLTILDDQGITAKLIKCYTRIGAPNDNGIYQVVNSYRVSSVNHSNVNHPQRLVKIGWDLYIEDVNDVLYTREGEHFKLPFTLNTSC